MHLIADHHLVVHHDYYLGRTEPVSDTPATHRLADLRDLDTGHWFDVRFAGLSIPKLREVFHLGKGKIRFEIDMHCPSLTFLRLLMDEITRYGIEDDVELTSLPMFHYCFISRSIQKLI